MYDIVERESGNIVGSSDSLTEALGRLGQYAFPEEIREGLVASVCFNNGFDPNSVKIEPNSVQWKPETGFGSGGIVNGQSTNVPGPGTVTFTIQAVVLTT